MLSWISSIISPRKKKTRKKRQSVRCANIMPLSEEITINDETTPRTTSNTVDLIRKAEQELHEKPEWRMRDIQALREMVVADTDLNAPTDDAFLLRFLRARKFDYDRAFILLQRYYLIRLNNPDLYSNFRPSAVKNVYDDNLQMMLPNYDQCGRRVFIFRAGKWNPDHSTPDEIFRANQICFEKAIEEQETQINGIVAIVDMQDFGLQHVKYVRPAYVKKVLSLIQDCLPARFKGFHFVYENALFDMVYMVLKPFLNEKLKDRIICHGWDMTSLHQHISPEILPAEYGGTQLPMDNTEYVTSLIECDDQFLESTKFGYNSNYKHEVKKIEAIEGIVGNYYRKICVD